MALPLQRPTQSPLAGPEQGRDVRDDGRQRPDLLRPCDLMKRLGLTSSPFYARQKRGEFKHLEVKRPVGARRYSRALVDEMVAGLSTVRLGGSRHGR